MGGPMDWNLFWLVFGRGIAALVLAGSVLYLLADNVEATIEGLQRIRRQWDRIYWETFAPMGKRGKDDDDRA